MKQIHLDIILTVLFFAFGFIVGQIIVKAIIEKTVTQPTTLEAVNGCTAQASSKCILYRGNHRIERPVYHMTYNGHNYLGLGHMNSIVHDPDCPCHGNNLNSDEDFNF